MKFWFGGRFVYFFLFVLSGLLLISFYFLHFLLSSYSKISYQSLLNIISEDIISWSGFIQVVVIYMILIILIWISHYHSTLVIEEFTDDTGSDKDHKITGIETLLIVKLGRISQLYRDVNEQRPISTSTGEFRQISAVLRVDDPIDQLANAQSTTSKVSLGPIEIPLGFIISIFNNLGHGPRIRGSIRKEENGYVLLASMSGKNNSFTWKINSRDGESKNLDPMKSDPEEILEDDNKAKRDIIEYNVSKECPIIEMVKDLAYQIYTDIPTTGSYKWQATCLFNSGLSNYRKCLRTPKDQISNLKKAEQNFQRALAYDNTFSTAWYNLGVVYSEMKLQNAAEKAFLNSIAQAPNEPRGFYALAQKRYLDYFWKKGHTKDDYLNRILTNCSQVCDLYTHLQYPFESLLYRLHGWKFPDYLFLFAQNLNLVGLTYLEIAIHAEDIKNNINEKKDALEKSINFHKKALRFAWKNYSRLSSFGIERDIFKKIEYEDSCRFLATCMSDLGWALIFKSHLINNDFDVRGEKNGQPQNNLDVAEGLFKRALNLNHRLNSHCSCPELHWRLGVTYLCKGQFTGASEQFKKAIRINPRVTKYQFSYNFASYKQDPKGFLDSDCCNINGLEYAVKSFRDEKKEGKDDQWKSLNLLKMLMRSNPDHYLPCLLTNSSIERFLISLYLINDYLDYYDEDYTSKYTDLIKELEERVISMFEGNRPPECQKKCNPDNPAYSDCRLMNWMLGQIHIIKGRLFYYKAINLPGLDYEKIDDNLVISEKCYKYALKYFKDSPEEKIQVFSEIGLIKATRNPPALSESLFNTVYSHQLNPMGDYQHLIQGILGIHLKSYRQSINYINEALTRAYNIPDHSHYINNKYFHKLAYSHIQLASSCVSSDQIEERDSHLKNALNALTESYNVFAAGLKKELKEDEEFNSPNYCPNKDKFLKISSLYDSIMASFFWKGLIYTGKRDYCQAAYNFKIVSSYYQPDIVGRENEMNISWPGRRWKGFDEYVLSLYKTGISYYGLKNYPDALSCFDIIIGYKELFTEYDPKQLIGKKLWVDIHPFSVLITAYICKISLCIEIHACNGNTNYGPKSENILDKNQINYELFLDYISNSKLLIDELEKVLKEVRNQKIQDTETNEKIELYINLHNADLYQCKGLIALEFDKVIPEDVQKIPASDPTQYAIESFKKSIEYYPEAESYVFLLKSFEKNLNLKEISEDEKEDCIKEAKAFFDALKKIDVGKEHEDFIKEYEKKLKEFSKKDTEKKGTEDDKNSSNYSVIVVKDPKSGSTPGSGSSKDDLDFYSVIVVDNQDSDSKDK